MWFGVLPSFYKSDALSLQEVLPIHAQVYNNLTAPSLKSYDHDCSPQTLLFLRPLVTLSEARSRFCPGRGPVTTLGQRVVVSWHGTVAC